MELFMEKISLCFAGFSQNPQLFISVSRLHQLPVCFFPEGRFPLPKLISPSCRFPIIFFFFPSIQQDALPSLLFFFFCHLHSSPCCRMHLHCLKMATTNSLMTVRKSYPDMQQQQFSLKNFSLIVY